MILWGADVSEVTYIRLTLEAKLGNDPLGKNFNDSQPNDFSNFPENTRGCSSNSSNTSTIFEQVCVVDLCPIATKCCFKVFNVFNEFFLLD